MLASKPQEIRDEFLASLSPNALAALPWLFEFWARPEHQLPPEGAWTTWVILGGRGSGKTRAGAEWLRAHIEGATPEAKGIARRVALVAETREQARDIMVFGESGIIANTPPDRRPEYLASRHKLIWPNGAEAQLFSASNPEALRGPQFDLAWSDELAKWRRAEVAWDMLQFGLRLGRFPRQVVTTTPRDAAVLRLIIDDAATVTTTARTWDNRAFLADNFLQKITRRYHGTFTGRQELEGALLFETPGALFTRRMIDAARVGKAPMLDRIVVAVDPPVTSGPRADECGIIVAGRAGEAIYVLADRSLGAATPAVWAARVLEAYREFVADTIVAEVNQGGDLVAKLIRDLDRFAPVRTVRAVRSKGARAEPVSMLYEQGLVRHVGALPKLEEQLCAFGRQAGSPDRVDALVWSVTELTQGAEARARIRGL